MNCKRCSAEFTPVRVAQVYCSSRCRDAAKKHRKRSGDRTSPLISVARSGDTPLSDAPTGLSAGSTVVWPTTYDFGGPTPGALQGDDYPLEYHDDGYPKIPACLDRRKVAFAKAALTGTARAREIAALNLITRHRGQKHSM